MTAHVRKGFEKWRGTFEDYADDVRFESAFRAGVRFEQGRHREWASQYYAHGRKMLREHESVRHALSAALEILSRTPAGKREADKLREVLK